MKKDELIEIASQLKLPKGEKGIEMGNMMHETNINMTHNAIQNLNITKDDKILELGHGNAGHLEYLFKKASNLNYYGLEMSELMFHEAQKTNRHFVSKKQAFFSLYDGSEIPFQENFFDKIFTVNTIYFWKNPEKMLLEIYRVLKTKGIFCLTFAQEGFMKQLPFIQYEFELYTTEKAESLIERTSFRIKYSETLKEKIKSKTGELVSRDFTTIVLEK